MISSPLGTLEAIGEVCKNHLQKELDNSIQARLVPDWFLNLENAHVAETQRQIDALQKIDRSLRDALRAIDELHLDVDRAVERQVAQNLKVDSPVYRFQTFSDFDGQSTPIETNENLKLHVRAALSAFLGQKADDSELASKQPHRNGAAIHSAKQALSEINMLDIGAQAKANASWQKALVVKRCRQLWEIGTGNAAPRAYSGAFAKFLDDMVAALGKSDDWTDSESVMNAWRKKASHEGWFF